MVIEVVGHPKAFEAGYRLLGGGGRLVTVGLPITSTRPLDLINEAMDRLAQGQKVRQIITLDAPEDR